jgi:hypothetical protein
MSSRLHVAAALGFLATALAPEHVTAAETRASIAQGDMPAAIALSPDEGVALKLFAKGTQNYECRSKQGAPEQYEWALVAPEADLFDASGNRVGKHYAGPTWESAKDGSKVVGTVKARADSPEADAIPWLLLEVKEPAGQGTFARITSVQRAETHGGKAPAGPCHPGETKKVPYSAVYYFARAKSSG